MKFRIVSDGITFEAERTEEEYEKMVLDPENTAVWTLIENWSKKYPIL